MASAGQLLGWAEKLTQPLTGFEGQTSPLDTIYHQATQQFQQSTSTLLGPGSGPAAFQGDTATKMRSAVQDIQQVEQQFQNLQVLVNAAKACAKAVQDDLMAMESTAPRMIDIPTALMLMAAVGVALAAEEGQTAIPAAIINGLQVAVTIARADLAAAMASVPPDPPAVEAAQQMLTKAENALQTLQAFMALANDLKNDISQWTNAINGIGGGITPPLQTILHDISKIFGTANGILGDLAALGAKIDKSSGGLAKILQKLHLSGLSSLTNVVDKEALFAAIKSLNLGDIGKAFSGKAGALAIVGTLLGFAAGKDHSLTTLGGDLLGTGLSIGVGFIPVVGEVELAVGLVGIVGTVGGVAQNGVADLLGNLNHDPALTKALQAPAAGLTQGGNNVKLGSVFNDIGKAAIDGFVHHGGNQDAAINDLTQAGRDTVTTLGGIGQVATNLVTSGIDDVTALPFIPGSQSTKLSIIHGVNNVGGWITSHLNPFG